MTDYPVHPAAQLFPLMPDAEIEALAQSIKAHGQTVPVVLYQGRVLDGRNRILACGRAGVEPIVTEWSGTGDPVAWVLSINMDRRHLTPSQRSMIAARAKPLFAEQAAARERAGKQIDPTLNLGEGRHERESAAKAAEVMGVSRCSVDSASRVVNDGAPELVAAVDRGEVPVSTASRLTALSAERQAEVAREGKAACKAAARELREAARPVEPEPKRVARRTADQILDEIAELCIEVRDEEEPPNCDQYEAGETEGRRQMANLVLEVMTGPPDEQAAGGEE